jgi:hypothetical protein
VPVLVDDGPGKPVAMTNLYLQNRYSAASAGASDMLGIHLFFFRESHVETRPMQVILHL